MSSGQYVLTKSAQSSCISSINWAPSSAGRGVSAAMGAVGRLRSQSRRCCSRALNTGPANGRTRQSEDLQQAYAARSRTLLGCGRRASGTDNGLTRPTDACPEVHSPRYRVRAGPRSSRLGPLRSRRPGSVCPHRMPPAYSCRQRCAQIVRKPDDTALAGKHCSPSSPFCDFTSWPHFRLGSETSGPTSAAAKPVKTLDEASSQRESHPLLSAQVVRRPRQRAVDGARSRRLDFRPYSLLALGRHRWPSARALRRAGPDGQ